MLLGFLATPSHTRFFKKQHEPHHPATWSQTMAHPGRIELFQFASEWAKEWWIDRRATVPHERAKLINGLLVVVVVVVVLKR